MSWPFCCLMCCASKQNTLKYWISYLDLSKQNISKYWSEHVLLNILLFNVFFHGTLSFFKLSQRPSIWKVRESFPLITSINQSVHRFPYVVQCSKISNLILSSYIIACCYCMYVYLFYLPIIHYLLISDTYRVPYVVNCRKTSNLILSSYIIACCYHMYIYFFICLWYIIYLFYIHTGFLML